MTGIDKSIGQLDPASSVAPSDQLAIEPAGGGEALRVSVETLLDGAADLATAGDQALAASVSAEAGARVAGDVAEAQSRLQGDQAEAAARANADQAEAAARQAQVEALKGGAPVDRDSMLELSSAIDSETAARQAALAAEAVRADNVVAGEALLRGQADQAVIAANAAALAAESLARGQAIGAAIAALKGGVSSSNDTLAKLAANLAVAVLGAEGAAIVYATKTQIDADLAHPANTKAEVYGDTDLLNGVYQKQGDTGTGSWTRIADLGVTGLAARVVALEGLKITNETSVYFTQTSGDPLPEGIEVVGLVGDGGVGEVVRAFLTLLADGSVAASTMRVLDQLLMSGAVVGEGSQIGFGFHNYDFAVADMAGNVVVGLLDGEWIAPTSTDTGAKLLAKDARNRSYAEEVRNRVVTGFPALDHDYNLYVETGQSNRETAETWPSLSTVQIDGNLQLGQSIHSSNGTTFAPPGQGFQPLIAQVVDGNAVPLSPEQVAALAPGDTSRGESPGYGAVNLLKLMANQRRGVLSDPSRLIVLANVAQGGRTLNELKKNHDLGSVEYYGRYTSLVSQTKALADTAGKTHQVLGVGFMQGESEYLGLGLSHNRAAYKALLKTYLADLQADALATAGNAKPPGFFIWQVGGQYTRDLDVEGTPDLFVGMAIWEFARETPGVWLVGPFYQTTDKINHMDSNGSRWAGLKEALVLDRVINQRRDWEPLAPLEVEIDGMTIDIHYHVPSPPLRWGSAYRDGVAIDYDDKGFRVSDDAGGVPITAVEIVAPTIVRLTLGRTPSGTPYVWYADFNGNGVAHLGLGNLRDSDLTDPLAAYTYLAGSGMYASADIPALVDKPYDMSNWAIAHMLPAPWTRF